MNGCLNPLFGGMFIGAAASLLLYFNGRILGVSGILGQSLQKKTPDRTWRVAFLLGLVVSGLVLSYLHPELFETSQTSFPILILSGVLVGFGTRLGGGCTSGHGVCGISRLSKRSLIATLVFMVTGILTVFLVRNFTGSTP